MKNKRGMAHTDWIISIGLFLMYVIFMIIFLKPRLVTEEKPTTLLDLVEEKFNQEKAQVYMSPIFIELKDPKGETFLVDISASFLPQGIKKDHIALIENKATFKQKGFNYENGKIQFQVEKSKTDSEGNILHWLYFSSNNIESYIHSTSYLPGGQEEVALAEFGTTEIIEGIPRNYLNELDGKDYEDYKNEIGFPENKEFSIEITLVESEQEKPFKIGPTSPVNSDVFVRERHDAILRNDGSREGVVVKIKIW